VPTYWFNLSPSAIDLALAELRTVLNQKQISYQGLILRGQMAVINYQPINLNLLDRLGGAVWMAQQQQKIPLNTDPVPILTQLIKTELSTSEYKKIAVFGYQQGRFNPTLSYQLTEPVKQVVKLSYLNLNRLRISRRRLKDSLIYLLIRHKHTQYLLKLIWYYPWEAYYHRDKDKPFVQPTAGMLPPKIARMMVNLALNQAPPANGYLLDPFAGSGTILIEAIYQNQPVIGIEKHPKAFQGLQANLTYFQNKLANPPQVKLYHGRAESAARLIGRQSIAGVATEPYLGPAFRIKTNRFGQSYYVTANLPNQPLTSDRLDSILTNLNRLYYKWLKNLSSALKPGTKLVLVVPLFHFHTRFYRIKLFDKTRLLDYTLNQGPFTIKSQRDLAVRRQILVLRKV